MDTSSECDPAVITSCTRCGDLELCIDQVELLLCSRQTSSLYRFTCPMCQTYICRVASDKAIALLVQYGVQVTAWLYPQEWDEPHHGPVISWDDILSFHLELLPI